ncbi:hypothetical protein PFISCL1PPCAC_25716, partial [Pristionchus fissidentatus]
VGNPIPEFALPEQRTANRTNRLLRNVPDFGEAIFLGNLHKLAAVSHLMQIGQESLLDCLISRGCNMRPQHATVRILIYCVVAQFVESLSDKLCHFLCVIIESAVENETKRHRSNVSLVLRFCDSIGADPSMLVNDPLCR